MGFKWVKVYGHVFVMLFAYVPSEDLDQPVHPLSSLSSHAVL